MIGSLMFLYTDILLRRRVGCWTLGHSEKKHLCCLYTWWSLIASSYQEPRTWSINCILFILSQAGISKFSFTNYSCYREKQTVWKLCITCGKDSDYTVAMLRKLRHLVLTNNVRVLKASGRFHSWTDKCFSLIFWAFDTCSSTVLWTLLKH